MVQVAEKVSFNFMLQVTNPGGHSSQPVPENALPQRARANLNCRMLPFESPDSVEATIRRVVADRLVTVTIAHRALLSPPSPLGGEFASAVEAATAESWPGVPVIPHMEPGGTDGKFFRNAGVPTYGASGVGIDPSDVRAHGKDERVMIKALDEGAEHTYRLIRAFSSGAPRP